MRRLTPFALLLVAFAGPLRPLVQAEEPAVTIDNRPSSYVLANGLLSVEIEKGSGDIQSVVYRGKQMLHSRGYLNLHAGDEDADFKDHKSTYARLEGAESTVRVDPARSGGDLAEICIAQKALGAEQPFAVELHYALRRGESGLYAFLVIGHEAGRIGGSISQIRWLLRLRDELFDVVAIDDRRRWPMPPSNTPTRPLGPKESQLVTEGPDKGRILDKYHSFADAGEHFVHGWLGRESRIGCWMISGSTEDVNGGPTKQYNTAHFGRILMKIFSCTHYGAAEVSVGQEGWQKFYGPCLLYFNSDRDPDALWADAKAKAAAERAAWPYAWVQHPLYPLAAERGAVAGQLHVTDAQAPKASARAAWVGLAAPQPDWQQQSNGYQYWVRADEEGRFRIPNVRPGEYTLYAFADGILDQFRAEAVRVKKGETTEMQTLEWRPARYGRQVWQIGTPDRTAKEFRHGDDYRRWGLWLEYPKEFPRDVDFTIGKSNERTDWNYAQVNVRDGKKWRGTTWTVRFDLADVPKDGRATLRVALAAAATATLDIEVNGRSIGDMTTENDSAMIRAGIHGQYSVKDLPFRANLLRKGANQVTFTLNGKGNQQTSVMYDCVRLELDPGANAK